MSDQEPKLSIRRTGLIAGRYVLAIQLSRECLGRLTDPNPDKQLIAVEVCSYDKSNWIVLAFCNAESLPGADLYEITQRLRNAHRIDDVVLLPLDYTCRRLLYDGKAVGVVDHEIQRSPGWEDLLKLIVVYDDDAQKALAGLQRYLEQSRLPHHF